MKFSVNSQVIQEGIATVTRALQSKPAVAILEGVHITADTTTLTLACSDGQLTITWTCPIMSDEPGVATLPGKMLSELVRKLPASDVTFSIDDRTANIRCGKSRFRLSVLAGEYPQQRTLSNPASFSIPMADMKDLIGHVTSCISTDDNRPILTGALMDISPDTISMVALDGFRLALKHVRLDSVLPSGKDSVRAVIPRKSLDNLNRILPYVSDPLTVLIANGLIRFDLPSTQVCSTLLSGEYIDYARIIPDDAATTVRVNKTDLHNAIDRASLMAREGKNNLVRLDITDSSISVSSRSETGNVEEDVECDTYGNPITIAFNANYLVDALKNIPGDTLTLRMNSPSTPCVFTPPDGNDWLYLILPVRTT